jgi:hypothetical protein
MYKNPGGKTQYFALKNYLELGLTANQEYQGIVRISDITATPLWSRMRQLYDVGRICSYSIKFMPVDQPLTLMTYVSHDDQSAVTGSTAKDQFMRQPSLRIESIKDKGAYRSVNLKSDSRFHDFHKLNGGSGLNGLLTGIAGQFDTSIKFIVHGVTENTTLVAYVSFTLQTKGMADTTALD